MADKKQKFTGFYVPNSTQVPDALFDDLMADLSGAELKVVLYIIRRTFGFKRRSDTISISQMLGGITKKNGEVLDRGTGLSKPTLLKNLKLLTKKNIIIPNRQYDKKGGYLPTEYRLNIIGEPETNPEPAPTQEEDTLGKKTLPSPLGKKKRQGLVKEVNQALVKKRDIQDTGLQDPVFKTVNVNADKKNKNLQNLPNIPDQENKIDYLAEDIVTQLGDKHSLNFYKLVARKIPEQIIRQFLSEIKNDGAKNPARLFTYKINKYASEKLSQNRSVDLQQQKEKLLKSLKNPFKPDTG